MFQQFPRTIAGYRVSPTILQFSSFFIVTNRIQSGSIGTWKLSAHPLWAKPGASRCAIGTQLDAGAQREMLWRCTVSLVAKFGGHRVTRDRETKFAKSLVPLQSFGDKFWFLCKLRFFFFGGELRENG